MKQYLEGEVRTHYNSSQLTDRRLEPEVKEPLSEEPKDRGLYVATTYENFFWLELEVSKNGTPGK
jgi:hypothetical protein